MTIEKRLKAVSDASGLSEKEVKALVEKKKDEAAGLLTDHGALYALEKEYGVGHEEGKTEYTKISELKSNTNNINVVGVIKEVRPVKKFATQKRSGQFARLLLADAKGEANVVLWDKTAELVNSDKVKQGTVILIRNGYTREGLDKNPEVHVGSLSRILIDPKNVEPKVLKSLPAFKEELKKISEFKDGEVASTQGRALYLYPKSEFTRSDGKKGQRSSMIIEDQTGKIRVVMWDANADLIGGFSEGDSVKIENCQARGGRGGLELHIGSRGRVVKSDAKFDLPAVAGPKVYKLGEITANLENVTVAGRVMRILPVKEFVSNGRAGKLASLILVDDTGISRAVLWGEKTDLLKDINQGDVVLIKNGYVKQSMSGELEVHLSQRGTLQVNPSEISIPAVAALMDKHAEDRKIADIKPDDKNIRVTGKIEDVDDGKIVFEICGECGARIENVGGEWVCDICGETTPAYGMVVSCSVADSSGDIRAIFYRDLAEGLTGLSVADALNMIGKKGDEMEPIRHVRGDITGKKVTLVGNARYNDYQDKLELIVSSISNISDSTTPKKSASKKEDKEEVDEILKTEEIVIEEITIED